jgi:DNA-binding SARP family transcriptional activator
MPKLALYLLGPPRVELDGQAVPLGRHKAVALLAYLALTRQPHSRDALATLLWPELDQSRARGQLRRTLSLLNRTLARRRPQEGRVGGGGGGMDRRAGRARRPGSVRGA